MIMQYVILAIWCLIIAGFVGLVVAVMVATLLDWHDRRRNRVMYELTRSHKPRRPVAK